MVPHPFLTSEYISLAVERAGSAALDFRHILQTFYFICTENQFSQKGVAEDLRVSFLHKTSVYFTCYHPKHYSGHFDRRREKTQDKLHMFKKVMYVLLQYGSNKGNCIRQICTLIN